MFIHSKKNIANGFFWPNPLFIPSHPPFILNTPWGNNGFLSGFSTFHRDHLGGLVCTMGSIWPDGGFHSHGATPLSLDGLQGKIPSQKMDDDLRVPPWLWKPPYIYIYSQYLGSLGSWKDHFFNIPLLVGGPGPPLWKTWLRQLGWWHKPNISGKIQNSWQPNHQPVKY